MTKSHENNAALLQSSSPEEWKRVQFGDVAKKVSNIVDHKRCDLDRFVAGEHMQTDDFRIKEWGIIDKGYLGPAFNHKFTKGQILYGSRRTYLRKVSIPHFDGVCANTTFVIEPAGDSLIPELLPFVMQSAGFTDHSIRMSKGSTNPYINWKDIACYEFEVPEKEQQRRIANTLWAAEDCIVKCEQFVTAAEQVKQIMMLELFSKGIGRSELKEVKGFGKVPKEWEVKRFKELTYKIQDGTHITPHYIEKGIPFLRVTDIHDASIDLDKVKFISPEEHLELIKRCKPEKGDILYSKNGTIGIIKLVDWDWEFSIFVSLCLIKPKTEILETKFICYVLDSDIIIKQLRTRAKQMTVTNLHLEEINELKFPVPSKNEQTQIISILIRCDETIAAARANVAAAKALKMKIINGMLNKGKEQ